VTGTVFASFVAVVAQLPSPLESVAESVMQLTPVGLSDVLLLHLLAVSRFLALLGAFSLVLLAGGLIGAVFRIWGDRLPGRLMGSVTAFGVLAVAGTRLAIPLSATEVVMASVFVAALFFLARPQPPDRARRDFLVRTLTVCGGAATLLALLALRPLTSAITVRRLLPYKSPSGLAVAGLSELVTPSDRFYIMDKVLEYPLIGGTGWRLTVDGAVERPLSLDTQRLLAWPRHSAYVTLECVDNPVGGPLMGNALWTGVPVAALLHAAGAKGNTVLFHAADDYAEPTPVDVLVRSGALVAYAMNGETLSRAHGYPARLVLPGIYGFKSVKWLTRLEVVHGPAAGHWAEFGWTPIAVIHTSTRIDVARRNGNYLLLAGVAFAGSRGIQAVEVRANGGPWRRASLGPATSCDSWVQWAIQLHGPGQARVEARAIDGDGAVQPEKRHGAYPDGSTGWATVVA